MLRHVTERGPLRVAERFPRLAAVEGNVPICSRWANEVGAWTLRACLYPLAAALTFMLGVILTVIFAARRPRRRIRLRCRRSFRRLLRRVVGYFRGYFRGRVRSGSQPAPVPRLPRYPAGRPRERTGASAAGTSTSPRALRVEHSRSSLPVEHSAASAPRPTPGVERSGASAPATTRVSTGAATQTTASATTAAAAAVSGVVQVPPGRPGNVARVQPATQPAPASQDTANSTAAPATSTSSPATPANSPSPATSAPPRRSVSPRPGGHRSGLIGQHRTGVPGGIPVGARFCGHRRRPECTQTVQETVAGTQPTTQAGRLPGQAPAANARPS